MFINCKDPGFLGLPLTPLCIVVILWGDVVEGYRRRDRGHPHGGDQGQLQMPLHLAAPAAAP